MKICITGATGFVGSHLYEACLKKGFETLGLARNLNKWNHFELPGEPLKGDLSPQSIRTWVQKLPSDLTHVVHTAGIVHSFHHEKFFEVNTEATKNLFDSLKDRYPHLHFVFISSLAAMGPSLEGVHDESDPLNPTSLYGESKKQAEEYLKNHLPKEWSLTIIRPPMVIGPRDPAVLDIYKMVKGRLVLETGLGGRHKKYSFVCVHDVVGIILEALKKDHKNLATYFTAHPHQTTFKEIILSISEQMKKKPIILPIPFIAIRTLAHTMATVNKVKAIDFRLTPDKLHELYPDAWLCSGERAIKELGYQYQWGLKETLELTLKDYQKRQWL
jgi:nucleoside-diphosphate-sugar epimerase